MLPKSLKGAILRVYETSIYRIGQPELSNPNRHAIIWNSGYGRPRILVYVQISALAVSVRVPIKYLSLKRTTINVRTVLFILDDNAAVPISKKLPCNGAS